MKRDKISFIQCKTALALIFLIAVSGYSKDEAMNGPAVPGNPTISDLIIPTTIQGQAILTQFGNKIDPGHLIDYEALDVPDYITKNNGKNNPITNVGATLGPVLFYDKSLSIDNSISCSRCHQQQFAFSDTALVSSGVEGGLIGRHSMRLINTRFGIETKFFWDEMAKSLEDQTTMSMKDHGEMGFSGEGGRPDFDNLMIKLSTIDYFQELFTMTYGDPQISESRMQKAIAKFVRSIQSFDSRYDEGYNQNFSNFNASEKRGRILFNRELHFSSSTLRTGGGLGCFNYHQPPEFDIVHNIGNNGDIGVANKPGEIDILIAFLKTLSGQKLFTDVNLSDPF